MQRGDDWAKTNRYTNRQTGTTTRTIRTDEGSAVTRRGENGGKVGVGDGGTVAVAVAVGVGEAVAVAVAVGVGEGVPQAWSVQDIFVLSDKLAVLQENWAKSDPVSLCRPTVAELPVPFKTP